MNCPNENTLAWFVQGQLQGSKLAELEVHLDSCTDCLAVVGTAARRSEARGEFAGEIQSAVGFSADDGERPAQKVGRGTMLGRYVVTGNIGAGAMGVVYAAYDPELDRQVAIKLLSPRIVHVEGSARLQREAQVLARLSHPNVVAVYDVGEFSGQLFIAMELVSGQTLSAWLRTAPRRWDAILDVFMQVGAGLQAAHDAEIIHRDFKPDNALIDTAGRVRVMDFGLAVTAPQPVAEPVEKANADMAASPNPELLLYTDSGALIGTPYYMAPEQLLGRPASVQSDVYAFCVSLFEGLYGMRPFAAADLRSLRQQKEQTLVRTPPAHVARRVPTWLRRIILRGLSADSAARFPSVAAVLAELRLRRRRLRTLSIGGLSLGVLALVIGITFFYTRAKTADAALCAGANRHLRGVWNSATQAKLERNLGPKVWPRVSQRLQHYVTDWLDQHRAACLATQRYHEQSEHVFEARMSCLESRRRALSTAIELFVSDLELRSRAEEIAAKLPAMDDCADVERAVRSEALPEDPALRAEIRELRAALQGAQVFVNARRLTDAEQAARALEPRVHAVADFATSALYYSLRGATTYYAGEGAAADKLMAEAASAAVAAGRADLLARASSFLAHINCGPLQRPEQGLTWSKLATAALANWGIPNDDIGSIASILARTMAGCQRRLGRLPEALLAARQAVALAKKYPQAVRSDVNIALGLEQVGLTLFHQHNYAEAEAALREALAALAAQPDDHNKSIAAGISAALANSLHAHGHSAEAVPLLAEAVADEERKQRPNLPNLINRLINLCNVQTSLGQFAAADTHCRRAIALRTSTSAHSALDLAIDRVSLAELLRRQGHLRAAAAQMVLARPAILKASDASAADLLNVSGLILRDQGKWQAALTEHRLALSILDKVGGFDDSQRTIHLVGIGECLLKQDKSAAAVATLRRALSLVRAGEIEPYTAPSGRAWLAMALWNHAEASHDATARAEALALFAQAQREFAPLPLVERAARELAAFMASHRLASVP